MSDPRFDVSIPENYTVLGEKVHLPFSGRDAPSRFMKGAMTERLSSWDQRDISKRGIPSKGLIKVYEEWGKGGYGIILSGNTMINPIDLEAPGNPIISKDLDTPERAAAFEEMAKVSKAHGSLYITQLSHGGRQVANIVNKHPVSASDVKLEDRMGMTFEKPTPLTIDGIKDVIDQFTYAAKYCYDHGSDGVQLHAAHGYLLSQFLAGSTNKRTDNYGGSLHNRARIIYEAFTSIRKAVPDPKFILAIKINSVEFQEDGFSSEDCREVCKELEKLGVDVLELSGGTYEELGFAHKKESTKQREAFFLEFSDIIRDGLSKDKPSTIWVTGGFRTAKAMVNAVENGSTQGIGLARPATDEFDLPKLLIQGKVPSSRKSLLPETDFGITNMASGTQIRQVAHGQKPFNTTSEEEVAQFKARVGEHMEKMGAAMKEGRVEAGYPDLAIKV
jgi:2,4-dienoyl-CoA reductase-like NADH-dependent reductase (Old Yellow Enzyme family)